MGKYQVGEMSRQGNVLVGKCLDGEVYCWENLQLRSVSLECVFREVSVEKYPVRELSASKFDDDPSSEAYLELCPTSMMKLFYENGLQLKAVN